MARKYDFISELYNRTCKTVVASPASWEAFLRSACYNYRLRFDEQLLVHAQRPDATAVPVSYTHLTLPTTSRV